MTRWIPPSRVPFEVIRAVTKEERKPFNLCWPSLPIGTYVRGNTIVIAGAERR